MAQCCIRTEQYEDQAATWEDILEEIQTLDSPERGTTPRNGAFITIWFAQNGTDEEFIQCFPVYPKREGLLKRLFGGSASHGGSITNYTVEAATGTKIYSKQIGGKEPLARILRAYFDSRTLPDTSGWTDTGIL